jgi:hypothetical protein
VIDKITDSFDSIVDALSFLEEKVQDWLLAKKINLNEWTVIHEKTGVVSQYRLYLHKFNENGKRVYFYKIGTV